MDYILKIRIPFVEIGCNPGDLEIHRGESKDGAIRLFNWLDERYPGNVQLSKDTSVNQTELIAGNMDL